MKPTRTSLLDKGVKLTPQGVMIISGNASVAGVLPYTIEENGQQKSVGILTPIAEMLDSKSLDSLEGVGTTVTHPENLTDKNAKTTQVGLVMDAEPNGDFLSIRVAVWDEAAKVAINDDGYTDISCGYTCDLVPEEGYWYGSPYSFIKKNIRYNHVSFEKKGNGRNGSGACLKLDSSKQSVAIESLIPLKDSSTEIIKTMKIKLDGIEYELPDDVGTALNKVITENTALKDSNAVATAEKVTEVEAKLNETLEQQPEAIRVWLKALPHLGKTIDEVDLKLPTLDVMRSVVALKFPNTKDADSSVIKYLFNNLEVPATEPEKVKETEPEKKGVNTQDSGTKKPTQDTTKQSVSASLKTNLAKPTPTTTTPQISSEDMSDAIAKKRLASNKRTV